MMVAQAKPGMMMWPARVVGQMVGASRQAISALELALKRLTYGLSMLLVLAVWLALMAFIMMPLGKVIFDYWTPYYVAWTNGKAAVKTAPGATRGRL